jgi:hypothetical protein
VNIKKLFKNSLIKAIELSESIIIYDPRNEYESQKSIHILFDDDYEDIDIQLCDIYDRSYGKEYPTEEDDKKIYAFLYVLNKRKSREVLNNL